MTSPTNSMYLFVLLKQYCVWIFQHSTAADQCVWGTCFCNVCIVFANASGAEMTHLRCKQHNAWVIFGDLIIFPNQFQFKRMNHGKHVFRLLGSNEWMTRFKTNSMLFSATLFFNSQKERNFPELWAGKQEDVELLF